MLTLFGKEPAKGHSMLSVCEPADPTHQAPSSKVMNSKGTIRQTFNGLPDVLKKLKG